MSEASEQLHDFSVSFAIRLERVKENTARKITKLLAQEATELAALLAAEGAKMTEFRRSRLQAILDGMEATLRKYSKERRTIWLDDLQQLASTTQATFGTAFAASYGISLGIPMDTATHLTRLVNRTLVQGTPIDAEFEKLDRSVHERVTASVRQSVIVGDTIPQAVSRLRGGRTFARYTGDVTAYSGGAFDISRTLANTLVRTTMQAVMQGARADIYERNLDVIKGVYALTTLDSRTSDICKALSGLKWSRVSGKYVPDGHGVQYPGNPPFHFNCRTQLLPIVKSWQEISGKKRQSIARQYDKSKVQKIQASMDGGVPADLNYEQWLKTKSATFQRQVLGPSKYTLWKAGKLTLRDLVNSQGRPLSVAQLKQSYE